MPSMEEDVGVDQELKGLKAAWRMATGAGGKKSKKGKSKKKVDTTTEESTAAPAAPAPWNIDPELKAHIATKKLDEEAKEIVEQAKKHVSLLFHSWRRCLPPSETIFRHSRTC